MIGVVLLGACTAADRTAWGQSFLALPAVATLACGWIVGSDALATSWYALALTALGWRSLAPVGEARPRDLALAAVLGPALAGTGADPARWGAALVLGLLAAELGGLAIAGSRELARRALPDPSTTAPDRLPRPAGIELRHGAFLLLHLLRGAVGVWLLLPAGHWLLGHAVAPGGGEPLAWFWGLAPALGLVHLVRSAWGGNA